MKRIVLLTVFIIPLLATAQISGTVTDSQTGQPLAGCLVQIIELSKATLTNDSGHFEFKELPQGKFTLELKYLGYKNRILEVYYAGKPVKLNINLKPSPVKTEEVVITGFLPSTQHSAALKIESIDLSSYNLLSPNVLNALAQVPGVELYSKGVGIAMPVIRGLSKTNIVVLNNGFRLEDYQFSENHPFFIDEFGTSRIEVIKGTASLLYGSDAIGGVINALWEKTAPVGQLQYDYSSVFYTNGRGIVQNAGIKHSTRDYSFGLRAGLSSNADIRDGAGRQVINTRFLRQTVKGFNIFTRKKASYKLFYEYSRDKLGLCVKPAFDLVTDDRRFPEYFYQDLNHLFIGNKNQWFVSKNSKLLLNLSYEHNRRGLRVLPDQPKTIDMDLHNVTYDLRFQSVTRTLSYVAGLQGYAVTNKNYGQSVFLPDYSNANLAAYFLLRYAFAGGSNIIGGLRYDRAFMHFASPLYSPGQFPDTLLAFGNLSGSVGGTLKLSPWLIMRLNAATGYRNPNAAELAENGIHAFRYEIGDLNLKAQRSYEADISLHLHTRRLIADGAVFFNNIKNYIYLDPTQDTASNGMKIYRYRQTVAVIYGFELGQELNVNNLDIKLIYSYLKSSDARGFSLPFMPQNKLKGFFTYSLKTPGKSKQLNVQINPVYAFAYRNPAPTELPSDSYFLLNVNVSLDFTVKKHKVSLGIGAYNLLNAKYNDHLSSLRDAGFYDMGRNIMFSLKTGIF